MSSSPTCVQCGTEAPAANTDYTLISANFGWRVIRQDRPDGSRVMEWRCPSCWRAYKASRSKGAGTTPDEPPPPGPAVPGGSSRRR